MRRMVKMKYGKGWVLGDKNAVKPNFQFVFLEKIFLEDLFLEMWNAKVLVLLTFIVSYGFAKCIR